jgi:hypothetical protein
MTRTLWVKSYIIIGLTIILCLSGYVRGSLSQDLYGEPKTKKKYRVEDSHGLWQEVESCEAFLKKENLSDILTPVDKLALKIYLDFAVGMNLLNKEKYVSDIQIAYVKARAFLENYERIRRETEPPVAAPQPPPPLVDHDSNEFLNDGT